MSTPSFSRSIRWQLQSWHPVILLAVVSTLLVIFYQYERREKLNRLDETLQQILIITLPRVTPHVGPGMNRPPNGNFPGDDRRGPPQGGFPGDERRGPPQGGFPGGDPRGPDQTRPDDDFSSRLEASHCYFVAWDRERRELKRSSNAPAFVPAPESLPPGSSLFRDRDGYREIVHDNPGGTVVVGVSTQETSSALRAFALELCGLGLIVVVIGLVAAWLILGRAMRPIESISSAVREIADGNLDRRIEVRENDSEFSRLADVLNQTFERLEKAFEQQTRFSADASHELRTPVSVILAQTQLALARERQPEEYRQALDICRRNAEGMRGLVNALMELSRIDSAQSELSLARHDLASLASDCVELIQPLAEELGIPISITADSAPVQVDRDKISRVITNLITNALRHNRPGGEVLVTVRQEKNRAFVEVADTGPGISPEDLPHIFERFYRADKARTRGQGGSGLGLAICQAFVTAHGGTLRAESSFGHGCTFTIELPSA